MRYVHVDGSTYEGELGHLFWRRSRQSVLFLVYILLNDVGDRRLVGRVCHRLVIALRTFDPQVGPR